MLIKNLAKEGEKQILSINITQIDGTKMLQNSLLLARDLHYPLIRHTATREGWPDVIAKDIQEELHRFMSATYITIGRIAGNTYLPLPYFGTEEIEMKEDAILYNDKERELHCSLDKADQGGPATKSRGSAIAGGQCTCYEAKFLCYHARVTPGLEAFKILQYAREACAPYQRNLQRHHYSFEEARMHEFFRRIYSDKMFRYMGNEIWTSEPEHAMAMVHDVIECCENFKEVFHKFKERSIAECPDNPWRFQNDALFEKLDSFLERCNDILNLMTNLNDFKTLKYLEIGGSKGKTLTSSVYQINSDFEICVLNFQNANIDIFDAESKMFDEAYFAFKTRVIEAFEDCSTIIGRLKLLQSFGNLLHRDVMQDIQQVTEIFNTGKHLSRFHYNSPPHAGAVMWSRGLLERIQEPMLRFQQIYSKPFNRSEGQDIENQYSSTLQQMRAYEEEHIAQWSENVLHISEEKLKMPLLKRISAKNGVFLSVNFDPALICLLREVREVQNTVGES
eukprot:767948-Hanusia_phi.AAC.9